MKALAGVSGIFLMFLAVVIYLANSGQSHYWAIIYTLPGGDKLGHVILMGLAAFLVNLLLKGGTVRIAGWSMLLGNLIVAVVVTVEELSQLRFASRNFSLVDLGSSYLGILLFGKVAAWWTAQQRNPERT